MGSFSAYAANNSDGMGGSNNKMEQINHVEGGKRKNSMFNWLLIRIALFGMIGA